MFTQNEQNGIPRPSAHARVLACRRRVRKSRARLSAALPRTRAANAERASAAFRGHVSTFPMRAATGGNQA